MNIAKKIEVFIENTIINFNKPDEDDIETTIGDTTIRIKKNKKWFIYNMLVMWLSLVTTFIYI